MPWGLIVSMGFFLCFMTAVAVAAVASMGRLLRVAWAFARSSAADRRTAYRMAAASVWERSKVAACFLLLGPLLLLYVCMDWLLPAVAQQIYIWTRG